MKKRNQLLALCALVILVLTVFACENPFIPGKYKEPAPPQAPTVSVDVTPIGPYVKGEGVTVTAKASVGDGGELSYQWYSNTKNSNSGGTKISGATGESYRPSTDMSSDNILEPTISYYYVQVTNTLNGRSTSASSRAVDVAVFDIPAGITPIKELAVTVIAPVKDATPSDMVTTEAGYTLLDAWWTPGHQLFRERTEYTVTVTLQVEPNHTFVALRSAKINGQTAKILSNNGTTVELEYMFSEMKSADKIEIKFQPSTLTYTHGDALSLNGLVITLTYNDGSTEDVASTHFTARNITTNPAHDSALSHTNHNGKPIVISYTGVTANTNNLTVNKAQISTIGANKITVVSPSTAETPNLNATVDSLENYASSAVSWTVSGTPVTGNFAGNQVYTAAVTLTAHADYLFANPLNARINNGVAAVSNNTGTNVTLSLTFSATTPAAVTGISIKTQPTTLSGYTHGDTLNLTGLVVTVNYVSGTEPEDVTLAQLESKNITTNPANGEVLNRLRDNGKPVTVSMGGHTADTTGTLSIAPRTITVAGTSHTKIYDGNTSINIAQVGVVTFNDVLPGDSVTGEVTAAVYTNENVPTKTINITNLTFSGTAASNYTVTLPAIVTLTGDGDVGITPANPTVNTWPTAANVNYGAELSTSALSGGSATGVLNENVPGQFNWTNPNTVPGGGIQTASVTFTPTSANYRARTGNVSITVNPQITFVMNGATSAAIPAQFVTYNTVLSKPTNPTRTSYTFDNWYTDSGFTAPFNFPVPVTSNSTLYAKWILTSDITNVTNVTNSATNMQMVFVGGGTFVFGQDRGGGTSDVATYYNEFIRDVTLSSFYIGMYEVTQEQYQSVMGYNPSYFDGSSNRSFASSTATRAPASGETQGKRPVENMSWWDALDFCNKLSTQKGLQPVYTLTNPTKTGNKITNADVAVDWTKNGYRLPTRAEWEYAAKGGHLMPNPPLRYAGSSNHVDVAWYRTNITANGSNNVVTHQVGQKDPNQLGTYDMTGNVSEMCWTIPESAGATQKVKGAAQVNPRSTVADILATSTTVANRYIYAAGGNWNTTNSTSNDNTLNLVVTWAWSMRLPNNIVDRTSASADLADLYNQHGSWYGFRVVRNAQ